MTHQKSSSSASVIISNFLKKYEDDPSAVKDQNKVTGASTFLQNYRTTVDKNLNTPFIQAEVRANSLDTGSDPNESAISAVQRYGAPDDIPAQFISKKLGGDGYRRNVYPAKPNVNLSESNDAQNKVYSFVKNNQFRSVKLYFGMIFEEPDEDDYEDEFDSSGRYKKFYFRPMEIFYKFEFYENDKIVGTALEGKIDNKLSK